MIKLDQLTKPYLKQLADECNIIIDEKASKQNYIKNIEKSDISEKTIEQLFNKYLAQLKNERKEIKNLVL